MFRSRGLVLVCSFFLMFFVLLPAGAEELNKTFSHSLGVGSQAQSYEHRIDLPAELAAAGKFFISRSVTLDGKLVIEREELTKTFYYVKVRLPKATLWFAKGSIDISLRAEKTDAPPVAYHAPKNLKVWGGYYPRFSWSGAGNYSAISLLDRNSGKTLWERVLINTNQCFMDEGSVRVNGRYTWAVKQAGECGRYSPEAQSHFRVVEKMERCLSCFGQGYTTCRYCRGSGQITVTGPNGTPVSTICRDCNGTGRERCFDCNGAGQIAVPEIVQETPAIGDSRDTDSSRIILKGIIGAIELSEVDGDDLQGTITIRAESVEQTFLVSKYTLILIEIDGYLRVTTLKHLRPGWKCELAYDIPDDDDYYDNMDLAARLEDENGMKYADNMLVYRQP